MTRMIVALSLSLLLVSFATLARGGRLSPPEESYELKIHLCDKPSALCTLTMKTFKNYAAKSVAADRTHAARDRVVEQELEAAHARVSKMEPGRERVAARRQAYAAYENNQIQNYEKMMAEIGPEVKLLVAHLLRHPEVSRQSSLLRFGFFSDVLKGLPRVRVLPPNEVAGSLRIHQKLIGMNFDFIKDCRLLPEDSYKPEDFYTVEKGDGGILFDVAANPAGGLLVKLEVDAGIHRKIDNCGDAGNAGD